MNELVKIGEVIDIEMDRLLTEFRRLQKLQAEGGMDELAQDICPNCRTMNYHYDVKSNIYVCSYC